MRSSRAPLQPKEDPEIAAQEQRNDYHEDDKRFKREEFEENLLETGLELEKDEEVRREPTFGKGHIISKQCHMCILRLLGSSTFVLSQETFID